LSENALGTLKFSGIKCIFIGKVHSIPYGIDLRAITRRFSAAALASARCSQNIEAAMPPDPNEVSGRHAPKRGCQRQLTGVEIIAKKKPGGKPGEFFACYKRNKFIC